MVYYNDNRFTVAVFTSIFTGSTGLPAIFCTGNYSGVHNSQCVCVVVGVEDRGSGGMELSEDPELKFYNLNMNFKKFYNLFYDQSFTVFIYTTGNVHNTSRISERTRGELERALNLSPFTFLLVISQPILYY